MSKYLSEKVHILILQIGINDTQFLYKNNKSTFEKGLEQLVLLAKDINPDIKIVLMCPGVIKDDILKSHFSAMFDETSIEKSKYLIEIYSKIAEKHACFLLKLDEIVNVSNFDGLHYMQEEHKKIALKIVEILSFL